MSNTAFQINLYHYLIFNIFFLPNFYSYNQYLFKINHIKSFFSENLLLLSVWVVMGELREAVFWHGVAVVTWELHSSEEAACSSETHGVIKLSSFIQLDIFSCQKALLSSWISGYWARWANCIIPLRDINTCCLDCTSFIAESKEEGILFGKHRGYLVFRAEGKKNEVTANIT